MIEWGGVLLQIVGLNAPIPPGGSFGYQAGGWGKTPVNEDGIPLYGDVFGERRMDDDDEAVGTLHPTHHSDRALGTEHVTSIALLLGCNSLLPCPHPRPDSYPIVLQFLQACRGISANS
jgi:hypothetical protein